MECPTGDHKTPPSRRPNGPTDDHGQPLGGGKRDDDYEVDMEGISRFVRRIVIILATVFFLAMAWPMMAFVLESIMFVSGIPGTASGLPGIGEVFDSIGGFIMEILFPILLFGFIIFVIAKNVRVVPQANAFVIERLGKYHATWQAGLHIKLPLIDRVAHKTSLKEQVLDFEPQSVITKDNVSMKIDTVVYMHVVDPKLLAYGVEHAIPAIENLTATTLRNIIGDLTLDDTLTSRDTVNGKLQVILDEATDPWGIKVNRVELKNIIPPKDIQEAMEKQMRAEREKREAILKAEGTKEARILEAAGAKEATILQAEAAKQKAILEAEADKQAAITRAQGKAEAIKTVKAAEAEGITAVKSAGADDAVVRLESLKTLAQMANGQASTIIIPSDLAGMAGTLAGLGTALKAGGQKHEAKPEQPAPNGRRQYGPAEG